MGHESILDVFVALTKFLSVCQLWEVSLGLTGLVISMGGVFRINWFSDKHGKCL